MHHLAFIGDISNFFFTFLDMGPPGLWLKNLIWLWILNGFNCLSHRIEPFLFGPNLSVALPFLIMKPDLALNILWNLTPMLVTHESFWNSLNLAPRKMAMMISFHPFLTLAISERVSNALKNTCVLIPTAIG